jgi:hypothetical protein
VSELNNLQNIEENEKMDVSFKNALQRKNRTPAHLKPPKFEVLTEHKPG